MDNKKLFLLFFDAPTEKDVEHILKREGFLQNPECWKPLGQIESNYGIVENQQASPIPALIEKITNGTDAILMRKCLEQGIGPKSQQAPRSIAEAVEKFFPKHKDWDLTSIRNQQAEWLQIIAHGPKRNTSLVVYDDGEGQKPEDFEETFLSLLRGNKNDIHFVQGKYNMGGTGAVAFCGEKRFQLICSKRFDDRRDLFGFTLVRRHPLTSDEEKIKKSTWYEYLIIDGKVPSFPERALSIGLYNREFVSGTVIKLYSYDLPKGSRSVISRDLNRSINEYFFNPALPIYTIDSSERYPHDRNLQRSLYGLKRRLEQDDSQYVENYFSEDVSDEQVGKLYVTCYVFKSRANRRSTKKTRETIRSEFFLNGMAVLFSMSGQVHGHYTSGFITQSLKFPLLRDHLLIHVDCTNTRIDFRNELFMASRDRLKEGKASRMLRAKLVKVLNSGRLKDIHKARKASITVENEDAQKLVQNLSLHLPLHGELIDLLANALKTNQQGNNTKNKKKKTDHRKNSGDETVFPNKRFPTYLQIDTKTKKDEALPMFSVPLGGEKIINFSTDVEDHYFDRMEEPGDFQIALLAPGSSNGNGGGSNVLTDTSAILDVVKSSPQNGKIRIKLTTTKDARVGDIVELQASLSSPSKQLEQVFQVKISESRKTRQKDPKENQPDTSLGLPALHMVYKDEGRGKITWETLEGSGVEMDHNVVVYPLIEGDKLSAIYINMDSNAVLSGRSKVKGPESMEVVEKRYVSAVYFHVLFLYTITKNKKYVIAREHDDSSSTSNVSIQDYISDLFQTFYAQFLLNFDTQELIAALEA